ncbi:MAG: GPP34 family phosphoprotein [Catenulispora sp.]|nr:GPP34 family phosphoprotein [Catenulispora sp.]
MGDIGRTRTGRLADDFFLMVHDDLSGRPRLSERILGLGLAGALLAELIALGVVDIEKNVVRLTGYQMPAVDSPGASELAEEVLRDVEAEASSLPVQDWLAYLCQLAPERVGRRLEAAGLVYFKASALKALRRSGRWIPVDVHSAGWPAIDVKLRIYNGKADPHTLMLFGLARATGLKHPSLWEVEDRLQDPVVWEQTLRPLVAFNPALLDLLGHTEAVVGSAITSGRIS